jgi:predicted Mrr-cat superfamily restriction endonuclease
MVEAGKGLSPGTETTSSAGMVKALAVAYDNLDQEEAYIVEIKRTFFNWRG